MTPVPPRGHLHRRAAVWLPVALLLFGTLSCGRSLPVAPDPASPGAPSQLAPGTSSHRATRSELVAEYLGDVAVMPVRGTNVYRLAADFGATAAPTSNYDCVRFTPAAGESPEHLARRLMTDPRVVVAERNAVVETAETRQESYASDDGLGSLQTTIEQPATEALAIDLAHRTSDGSRVRVAVLDTGADPNHRWLRHRIVTGYDLVDYDFDFTDVGDGLDTDLDGRIDEAYGHGTHVAGIVSLAAPGADLMIVRVLDADGRGDIAAVTAGLQWAIDSGADVINLSLGLLTPSRCIETMLERASARGIIVVASAGNAGTETPREYPASSPLAIAVAACDAAAHPAPFTSFGEHVAVAAPGIGVRSAYPGNHWRLWSGTSMSAPFVSGTAALLRSRHPGWGRTEVLTRLAETATPLVDDTGLYGGKLGVGMLHVGRALAADGPGRRRGLP